MPAGRHVCKTPIIDSYRFIVTTDHFISFIHFHDVLWIHQFWIQQNEMESEFYLFPLFQANLGTQMGHG